MSVLVDDAWDLEAVGPTTLAVGPYYARDETVITIPVIAPPRHVGGGGGRISRMPRRPRPVIEYKFIASGGVLVGGEGGALWFNDQDLRQHWRNEDDAEFLFDLL